MPTETVSFNEGTDVTVRVVEAATSTSYTWRVLGGTATYGTDYTFSRGQSGSVSNPPVGWTFVVSFKVDALTENEWFDLEIVETEDGETETFVYRVNIIDPFLGRMSLSGSTLTVDEGAILPLGLTWSGFTQPTLYSVQTVSGSAAAGSDFLAYNTVGTASGQGQLGFTITTLDDAVEENPESFQVTATPGRGTGAAVTIQVLDNDRLKCLLDLDGDGKAEQVEIGFSQAKERADGLQRTLTLLQLERDQIDTRLEALKDEEFFIKAEAAAQLTTYLTGVITAGTSNTAVALMSAITPLVQALSTQFLTGEVNDEARANAMRAFIGTMHTLLENPTKWLPIISLLESSLDAFNAPLELNKAIIDVRNQMKALKEQKLDTDADIAAAQAALAAAMTCLIQSGAVGSADVAMMMAAPATAELGPQAATATSSLLPAGLGATLGSSGGDRLISTRATDTVWMAAAGAGDDRIYAGKGASYIDGDVGQDVVSLLDGSGRAATLSSLRSATVLDAQSGLVSLMFKDGRYVAAKNVETFAFADGYAKVSGGAWTTATFAAPVIDAARNILRGGVADGADQAAVGSSTSGPAWNSYVASLVKSADATTSVATLAYQFFTGKIPSLGGIDYLVSPTGPNPNNLNSAYYQSFNLENRYINFAVNLGKEGEGKAQFAAAYGGLTLSQATKKAYEEIFGLAPTDAKVAALLSGGRDLYFEAYGRDGVNGVGTKAAMVGWLLAEAEKGDVGMYARSNAAFLTDLADGATFAVDLIGTYGKAEFDYGG